MKYVVVDLEMNPVDKAFADKRAICKQEIIEIGAVVLNETYEEIASFKTYVKPRFNTKIQNNIAQLTGITYEMVEAAPGFEEAFEKFIDFCYSIDGDITMIQWSENDKQQVVGEASQKGYEFDEYGKLLMENWCDFQEEFGKLLGLDKRVSLENALMYAGEDFCGQLHDALYDARNTAELFSITRIPAKRDRALATVEKILHPERETFTMADLFDFSNLKLA